MFRRKLLCASFCHVQNSLLCSFRGTFFENFPIVSRYSLHSLACVPLKHRQLLKIVGPDATDYLQGMVTNNVKHLNGLEQQDIVSTACIYSMLLNSQGRVLYDTILYKITEEEFLLEYDATALPYMQKHLDMYRLRKKVSFKPVNTMNTWVVFSSEEVNNEDTVDSGELVTHIRNKDNVVAAFKDPRVPQLGYRVVVENNVDIRTLLADLLVNALHNLPYDVLRYKLGVGEGVKDHPPGNCFPLECNIDFLHGVSFQKGCYIGQELTARFHHTGCVRKRLMPITFVNSEEIKDFPVACTVINENGLKMGKLRGSIGPYGLALLNVEESLKSEVLILKGHDIRVKTSKPSWWPQDMKEKL